MPKNSKLRSSKMIEVLILVLDALRSLDMEKSYKQWRFDAIPFIDESERKHYR